MRTKHQYGSPNICFRIPQATLDELAAIAYEEHLSMSELIRYAIDEYLREYHEVQKLTASEEQN